MVSCYNCLQEGHYSRDCLEQQRFQRCPVCLNVCVAEHSHRPTCSNKTFVSPSLRNSTVFTLSEVVEIEFIGNVEISIADRSDEVPITKTPAFSTATSLFIQKNDRDRISISSVYPNQACNISIIDPLGNTLLSFMFTNSYFDVNKRYRILANGLVKYNINKEGQTAASKSLILKLTAEDIFKVAVYKFDRFVFDVFPVKVNFLDLHEQLGQ